MNTRADAIRHFILTNLEKYPQEIVSATAAHFNVTRTTAARHLSYLIKGGKIIKSGTTKNTVYSLASSMNKTFIYQITPELDEFTAYSNDFEPIIKQLPKNIIDDLPIWFYQNIK